MYDRPNIRFVHADTKCGGSNNEIEFVVLPATKDGFAILSLCIAVEGC
jgi:hypothetical protein